MKLRGSLTSPFARKVRVLAIECGLGPRLELVPTDTTRDDWYGDNPLGKVPALIADDGRRIVDSPVICEYLDSLHSGRRLFPAEGPARWDALNRQALADGIMEAGVLTMAERRRPEGERSAAWVDRQMGKMTRTIAALDGEAQRFPAEPDIGTISVGCALGYIDFRFPDLGWRAEAPRLAAWYARFASRPSMTETPPPA